MRYAIIADIHEDIINLEIALKKIEKQKCDKVICLGDISGFSVPYYHYYESRNASECLRLIRENCFIIVAGNHDLKAAGKVPENTPEFDYPSTWFDMDFHEQRLISKGKLWLYDDNELNPLYTIKDIEFLRTLPEFDSFSCGSFNFLLSHYLYPNLTGSSRSFYSEHEEFNEHREFMKLQNCHVAIAGHRHYTGLMAATEKNGVITRRFNSRHFILEQDCIHVPQIAGNQIGNGFCIFETDSFTIKTVRI